MIIAIYITGVIIMLLVFWLTHKKEEITWRKLTMGILISLGSWITFIIMCALVIWAGTILFINWFIDLEFWDKKVF